MSLIREGHSVQVHYKGTLADGSEFDNSKNRGAPLQFEVGSGQLIKGFDDAVKGMGLGEVKKFTVDAANAYGYHESEAVQEYSKEAFPEGYTLSNFNGSNFYPFPSFISAILSWLLPKMSVGIFFKFKKNKNYNNNFLVTTKYLDTNYFTSNFK